MQSAYHLSIVSLYALENLKLFEPFQVLLTSSVRLQSISWILLMKYLVDVSDYLGTIVKHGIKYQQVRGPICESFESHDC